MAYASNKPRYKLQMYKLHVVYVLQLICFYNLLTFFVSVKKSYETLAPFFRNCV